MRQVRRALALAAVLVAPAAALASGGPHDLSRGFEKFAPLKPSVYRATLFAPRSTFTIPSADWNGAQWVERGADVVALAWRKHNGGVLMISAPASTQSAAVTVQRLRTERATGPDVGIDLQPNVPITIGGVRGTQFDGTVPGKYGHTFVPFSGKSSGASSSFGDHDRVPDGDAFRIVVLDAHGKVVFVEIDSDAPSQDPVLLAEAMKIVRSLRFTP
jgi:hypothetical protein